jgi:uncharacterized protein
MIGPSLIIRILLFVLAIWLILRLLVKVLVNKPDRAPRKSSDSGEKMVKDPVCGMYMDPRLAVKYEIKNGIFYFCSEECKNKFLQKSHGSEQYKSSSEK